MKSMKVLKSWLTVFVVLGACSHAFAQPPVNYTEFGFCWFQTAYAVSATSEGVYVAGMWSCDWSLPDTYTAFLVKFDANGQVIWSRQFGSGTATHTEAMGVSATLNGVYVVGYTNGVLPGQTNSGGSDAFIMKLDLNGNQLWTRQFGSIMPAGKTGTPDDFATSVTAIDYRTKDPSALGVYVVGNTNGVLPGQQTSMYNDAFIRKYDVSGNELWTRQFQSTNVFGFGPGTYANSVSTYDGSSIYISGTTEGALPGQTSAGSDDAFIRKYDKNGNELWTRQFGSIANDYGRSIKAADSGIIFVHGDTLGALPGQTSSGGSDLFLRKYDGSGNVLWTRQAGTSGDDYGFSVTGTSQAVYIVGDLSDPQNPNGGHSYIWKFDAYGGKSLWLSTSPTSSDAYGVSMTSGAVYVAGDTFDAFPGQTAVGLIDAYLAITSPN